MESWRKFLNESQDDFLNTLGLWVDREDNEYTIHIIYFPDYGDPKVIGWLGTMEMGSMTDGPCIPKTQEVGTAAVEPAFAGRGVGTYMYEVASYLLKTEKKSGITSDHSASTSVDAAWIWQKLEQRLNYNKRKTEKGPGEKIDNETGEITGYKGGNDRFDYDGSTPDPNDDCYEPSEGVAPSDHSLEIPDSRMGKISKIMGRQMDNLDSYIDMGFNFDSDSLQAQGMALFDRVYDANAPKFQGWKK